MEPQPPAQDQQPQQRARRPAPPLDATGAAVADILAGICLCNRDYAVHSRLDDPASEFDCEVEPSISIAAYMAQVQRAGCRMLWPQVLILMDQLCRTLCVPVHAINVHRLLVTASVIALKLARDSSDSTVRVAEAGGVSIDDLNEMEKVFLVVLGWRVIVSPAADSTLCKHLGSLKAAFAAGSEDREEGAPAFYAIPAVILPLELRFGFPLQDAYDEAGARLRAANACSGGNSPDAPSCSASCSSSHCSDLCPSPPPAAGSPDAGRHTLTPRPPPGGSGNGPRAHRARSAAAPPQAPGPQPGAVRRLTAAMEFARSAAPLVGAPSPESL